MACVVPAKVGMKRPQPVEAATMKNLSKKRRIPARKSAKKKTSQKKAG
jgi:hypothetical protein